MSIHLSGLSRRFGAVTEVNNLSTFIETGCFFVVLGPSGCGKSTALRMIAGLEPVDAGEIALGGRKVSGPGLSVPPEQRGVGVVFQSYALWPHMSVLGNVEFPIQAAGVGRATAEVEARSHLASVDLSAYANRRPADLSGGQRQRVALARCLAARAKIVLMDEPLANLDPHLRAAMEDELAAFRRRASSTTFYITHDQREAMALADRVAVMRDGAFEQVASPQEVHDRPQTEFVAKFIGQGTVIDGQVLGADGAHANIKIGEGHTICVAASPSARHGPARLLLRPSQVQLDPEGISARVVLTRYRGDHWEVRAEIAGVTEPLVLNTGRPAKVGDKLGLRITDGWLLDG